MAEETKSVNASYARQTAQVALYDVITDAVAEVRESEYSLTRQSGRIRELAHAFRLIDGGPQAGGVDVTVSK
ncbi:hypothetical protein [Microbacterium sp. LWH10-1.2]|uniref:hypothetical protein n=1 Tax=Microbacterium sp. LWH10-1.2 TaxID=3135255 RepID=UPI003139AAD1